VSSAAPKRLRVAVLGAGWAGLAAAVQASDDGHDVTVLEMAAQTGGRARRGGVLASGLAFDNGQHILIGAYAQTLDLMRRVGLDPDELLLRQPLTLVDAQGRGLALPPGRQIPALLRALWRATHWPLGLRWQLLQGCAAWAFSGFRCPAHWNVARLTAHWPAVLVDELIEPLCVAALNTPMAQASAAVFLRVLRDALFSAPGASDLLLPRVDLSQLLPEAANTWLRRQGAQLHLRTRAQTLVPAGRGWQVDGQPFDTVVLATSAVEAARLAAPHAPAWASQARALQHEPIVSVLLHAPDARLPQPMLALRTNRYAPAQFVFDLGQLRRDNDAAEGMLCFVISGAGSWLDQGADTITTAVMAQAKDQLPMLLGKALRCAQVVTERRATFACTPDLRRPDPQVAPGLLAAGDYVAGPYPATLEGAVRSGLSAGAAIARAAAGG
jgi:hydroxysqualene dehydroxylase